MKPNNDSQSRWLKGLGASLLASIPLLSGATMPAFAGHEDRLAAQLDRFQDRINLRQESRDSRQSVLNRANNLPTAATVGIQQNPSLGTAANERYVRRNTEVIFPGQVSTFRTTRPRSAFTSDAGKTRAVTRGVSLDLTSTSANITVGRGLFDGNVTINVGGQTKTVSAGTKLTAAEYAALNQMLSTGTQTLLLSSRGSAEGGALDLNSVSDDGATIRASELVIPQNVTVSGDFGRTADGVRVTKDLVNYGSLIATSSNAGHNTAVIAARDINNESGASIATQSSATNPQLNLAVRADRNLNNTGSISSVGDLEISAGRLINNQGLISTTGGDVTFAAPDHAALVINNLGGVVDAANGAINIRNSDYSGYSDSTIYGGNFFSKELNLNAGNATANMKANQVTGVVNSTGLAAHVSTNTQTLTLGSQCLTGDPTYYNTGDIVIAGDIIVEEALAIIAGGNITTTDTDLVISAKNPTGSGYDINIIAGANITAGTGPVGGGGTLPAQNPGSITDNALTPVTIDGGDFDGGFIDFTGATGSLTIDTRGSTAGSNGGNITLAAYLGGSLTGQVKMDSDHGILASGVGTGVNGNVTVVAGAIVDGSSVAQIDTNDGSGGGGIVTIANAQPTSSNGGAITFGTDGSITSGNRIVPSAATDNGVFLFVHQTDANAIDIDGVFLNINGPLDADSITLTSTLSTTLNADVTARNGLVIVTGTNITASGIDINTSSASGDAGNVVMVTGAAYTRNASTVTVTGKASVVASGMSLILSSFDTSSSAINGSGGDVTLVSLTTNAGTGGTMFVTQMLITQGNGTGSNGDIDLVPGGNIVFAGADTTGGTVGTGTVEVINSTPDFSAVGSISKANATYTGTFINLLDMGNADVEMNDGGIRTTADVTLMAGNDVTSDFTINTNFVNLSNAGNINLIAQTGIVEVNNNILASGAGIGDGGDIYIESGGGSITVAGIIQANGGSSGAGGDGGSVSLVTNSAGALVIPAPTTASGGGASGAGGSILLQNLGTGGINLSGAASYFIGGFGDGGSITLLAGTGALVKNSALTLDTNAGGAGFDNGTITVQAGSIAVNGAFFLTSDGGLAGTGSVSLNTTAGVTMDNTGFTASFRVITDGDISLSTGADGIDTNGGLVLLDAGGTIAASGANFTTTAQTLNFGSGGLTFTSGGSMSLGNITSAGNGTGAGGLMNMNAGGSISVGLIYSLGGGGNGSVGLNATDGNIDVIDFSTGEVTANLLGTTGGAFTGGGRVDLLRVAGLGSANFSASGNPLPTGQISGFLDVTLSSADGIGGIQITENISITGDLTLNTPVLTNNADVIAASILVQNTGGVLHIVGGTGSSMSGTTPPAGSPGSPSSPPAIQFVVDAGQSMDLAGEMSFTGDVLFNAPNGTVTSLDLSSYNGDNNVILNALNWQIEGNGTITGNLLIFTGISIVNPDGDVNIGDIAYAGRNVLIAARDNVIVGDISTASTLTTGGNVTVIAGFNMTPTGGGEETTQQPFSLVSPSTNGGSVTVGDIDTSSSVGSAGSVEIYARGGSILTGDITTTSTAGDGGTVLLVGEDGITTTAIDTRGTTGDGDVNLDISIPELNVGTVIQAGSVVSGGISNGNASTGPLTINGAVNTGESSIYLYNEAATVSTRSLNGGYVVIEASTFNLQSGAITVAPESSGAGGFVEIYAPTITAASSIVITAEGTTGVGGAVFIETDSNLTFGSGPGTLLQVLAGSTSGGGGRLKAITSGFITVEANGIDLGGVGDGAEIELRAGDGDQVGGIILNNTGFLSALTATGANSNGGILQLAGETILVNTALGSPLVINADGTGTGNGGAIEINTYADATPIVVGTPAKAPKGTPTFLSLSAESGLNGGDGGYINIETQGNIWVDTAELSVAARASTGNWSGGDVTLKAGNLTGKEGTLIVVGDIDVRGVGTGVGGDVNLESNNKKAFVVGSTKAPKNGILGAILTSAGAAVEVKNSGGGITIATNNAIVDSSDLVLEARLKGVIATGKDVVLEGNEITLVSENGAIGKKPFQVSAPELTIISLTGSANIASTLGAQVNLHGGIVGGDFEFSTLGNLYIDGNVVTTDGSISLTTLNGLLTVDEVSLTANNGSMTLAALSTTTGAINILANAIVETQGQGGNTVLAIGAPPKKGTNPQGSSGNFTVTPVGKGQAFFGPGGVVATGPVNVNPENKNVIFNNLSTTGANITIGGGTRIEADPPSRIVSHANAHVTQNITDAQLTTSTVKPVTQPSPTSTISFEASQIGMTNANLLRRSANVNDNDLLNRSLKDGFAIGASDTESGATSGATGSTTSSTTGSTTGSTTVTTGDGDLIVDAAFHSNGGRHALSDGSVVYAPSEDMTVETLHGNVEIKAGSIAVISQTADGLSVYDLHDSNRNAVVLKTGNKILSLTPGRHVTISSGNGRDYSSVNPIELVQHRALSHSTLDNGWKVYTSEVSIPSVCFAVKPLKQLMKSNRAEAKSMANRLLKTSAVLMTLSPDQGDFVQFFKSQATASL